MTSLPPDFYARLLDNLYDGVYVLDVERRISYWNRGAERISGYGASEVLGRRCADQLLTHLDGEGRRLCGLDLCPAQAVMRSGQVREAEVFLLHRAGHRVPVRTTIAPLRDEGGALVGAVEVFRDISAELGLRQRVSELERLALIDPLTGVGNRRHAELTLRQRLEEQQRYGWPVGVIFMDIDRFKEFNDRHGHEAGDEVLRVVGRTLLAGFRAFDVVFRWGGEELLLVVVSADTDQLATVAERARRLIAGTRVAASGHELGVTVSVGATLARDGDSLEQLVRRADQAMYASKAAGGDRVTI